MAGRPKGAKSAKTLANEAKISELAKSLAPQALKALEHIALAGESESARVAAANSILDRAYGKPSQAITHEGGEAPLKMLFGWMPTQN